MLLDLTMFGLVIKSLSGVYRDVMSSSCKGVKHAVRKCPRDFGRSGGTRTLLHVYRLK